MTTATATQAPNEDRQRPWWLTLISGILAMIIGGILLWGTSEAKVDTYLILVVALGIYWMMEGIFNIIWLFLDHSMWGWKLFVGIVSIIAGFYIMAHPVISALALPKIFALFLGIWGLMYGVILLISAFMGGGWKAGLLGALGIIFGLALMFNYYALGMGLAMLWSAAVLAVIGGIIMIVQAFRQRSAE